MNIKKNDRIIAKYISANQFVLPTSDFSGNNIEFSDNLPMVCLFSSYRIEIPSDMASFNITKPKSEKEDLPSFDITYSEAKALKKWLDYLLESEDLISDQQHVENIEKAGWTIDDFYERKGA